MGHRARSGRGTTTAFLAAALTASLAAGCTSGHGHGPVDDGRAGNGGPASPGPGGGTGQVLAVKIDNAPEARPQTGLDSADVVYAEQVEGGLSRLMAVYATKLPKVIGPVRSARESDLELLRQFDRPTLAFSGAQTKLLPLIDKAPLRPETPDNASGAFFRGSDRTAPHNLYLHPDRLLSATPGAAALSTGFHYGAAPAGGRPETSRTVRYPLAAFTFTWSADRHRWLVGMDGTATHTADGKRPAPATVVVQYVKVHESAYHDVLGNNTPYTETVGTGKAEVLRDGRAFDATWTRPAAADGTKFTTADGAPMNFARGQVWVVFAQSDH
ncbi:DUF3048 domain-containing protein [Streptomyces herbicida]|uniref:DUF3048 domain-containing protein n=1 Tax=Streptomyces herbicida TaxID=3065675 RepID=UPI00292F8706|nr:DUF3048 domain-containing protein [Streptomyces sp. NEAU-HV9]